MSGAHRGVDAAGDLARDLAPARKPRGRDVDIDRLGQDAPGELALRQHMHRQPSTPRRPAPMTAPARHRRRGGSRRARRARHRRSARRSDPLSTGNSDRRCRRRHWRAPRPARSAPQPCRLRPRHPVRRREWRCAAPQGASRPDASADKPWRCPSRYAIGRHHSIEHVFIFSGDQSSKSPEEVNNYSGQMTRRKCDGWRRTSEEKWAMRRRSPATAPARAATMARRGAGSARRRSG